MDYKSRKHPHRLPDSEYERLWQPVYFSAATEKRRPVLTRPNCPGVLLSALREAEQHYGTSAIAFCVMPDHVHLLACVSVEWGNVRDCFEHFEALSGHRIVQLGFSAPIWQRSYFDRHVRKKTPIWRVVNYILDNPVEAGLCARREDWRWAAYFGLPWEQ